LSLLGVAEVPPSAGAAGSVGAGVPSGAGVTGAGVSPPPQPIVNKPKLSTTNNVANFFIVVTFPKQISVN
jgi:hypothetical protein